MKKNAKIIFNFFNLFRRIQSIYKVDLNVYFNLSIRNKQLKPVFFLTIPGEIFFVGNRRYDLQLFGFPILYNMGLN